MEPVIETKGLTMEPVIETKGLKHVYIDSDNNPVTALDGIDLQIMPGEFVAVIGANGSGKSTLARHFNALLLPSEGSVNVHGLDTLDENNLWTFTGWIRWKKTICGRYGRTRAWCSKIRTTRSWRLLWKKTWPSGRKISAYPQRNWEDALRAVDMLEYREHAPHLLSGGQKQRVAIAGTLALGSRCIVLDEPTAMLDPKGRKEILSTVSHAG